MKKIGLVIFLIACSCSALASKFSANDCLTSEADFFNYERRVLSEVEKPGFSQLSLEGRRALKCVFNFYLQSHGLKKSIAGRLVSPFLGEALPKKLITNSKSQNKYLAVANSVQNELLSNGDSVLGDDLYQLMSDSHWSVYAQFCKPGLESICTGFLYDNKTILNQAPLAAAVSVSNLLRASSTVSEIDRSKLYQQLLDLDQTLSKDRKLLKKVVQEALDHFSVPLRPMGMVFS